MVEIELVLGGSVETFDADDFKVNLAASVGVDPEDVSLVVSAASILVVATFAVANESVATDLASTLRAITSNASAFGNLLNVTVENVEEPQVKTLLIPAPSRPPSSPPVSPPPSPTASVLDKAAAWIDGNSPKLEWWGWVLVGLAVLCPLLTCAVIVVVVIRRHARQSKGTTAVVLKRTSSGLGPPLDMELELRAVGLKAAKDRGLRTDTDPYFVVWGEMTKDGAKHRVQLGQSEAVRHSRKPQWQPISWTSKQFELIKLCDAVRVEVRPCFSWL